MTSYEKAVKGACKPKPNPPKAKYLDPILAATWSEDGAVHDVCKALIPRLREPNVLVAFKALIVLHTMIRNGSTDNVLSYLSSSDVLKLKNLSASNWEGYSAPQNIHSYAIYLDTRIRAYRELKHDAIRVQSENNRDMRNSAAIEDEAARRQGSTRSRSLARDRETGNGGGVQRSKTLAGRKLRVMTVEKGLLRETKVVQRMIDALLECRFYLDDLDNELNITALRMLVKDLLILFQACNEGVINVLEHYFEMFRSDAEEALNLYRHFCKQTERVVEYLGVAKKLSNILNVPVPNLRHAPVSLVSALEEYLNDPNFEQNRIEYKTNKEAAERNAKLGIKSTPSPAAKPADKASESKPTGASLSQTAPSAGGGQSTPGGGNQAMVDFFTAIEEEQQTMFNPSTNSPASTYFQQQSVHNPFTPQSHVQMPMMTGVPFGAMQPFGQPQMQPQPTGFIMPQHTSTNPFGMMQQPQQPPGAPSFLQPQQTAFLQPQATGANPFRQSMMMPQMTGMSPFGSGIGGQQQPTSTNPFPVQNTGQPQAPQLNSNMPSFNLFSAAAGSSQIIAPVAQAPSTSSMNGGPARPASAPLNSLPSSSTTSGPPPAQPVITHQTGSRNPFGAPVKTPPPMPKLPTLLELALNNQSQGQQSPPSSSSFNANGQTSPVGAQPTGSMMSSIASSFAFGQNGKTTSPTTTTSSLPTGSTFSQSIFSSLPSQPTGATTTSLGSTTPMISVSPANPLQPQKTGFSGLKPFKPSSSFGAALLESLPPIPQSAPTTPGESPQPSFPSPGQNNMSNASSPGTFSGFSAQRTGLTGLSSQPTGALGSGSTNAFGSQTTGALGSQPTGAFGGQTTGAVSGSGFGSGVNLRPQMTGVAGAANPFRASMFPMSSGFTSGNFGSVNGTAGFSSFSSTGLGNPASGTAFSPGQVGMGTGSGQPPPQQQQPQTGSLI